MKGINHLVNKRRIQIFTNSIDKDYAFCDFFIALKIKVEIVCDSLELKFLDDLDSVLQPVYQCCLTDVRPPK